MITRKMQVEERNERLVLRESRTIGKTVEPETTFELRQKNPLNRSDDRMTLVVVGEMPPWAVGSYVTVTIEAQSAEQDGEER